MLLQSEKVSQREFRSDRGRGVRNGLAVAVILVALVGWAGIGRAAGHSAAKADVPGDAKSPPGFMGPSEGERQIAEAKHEIDVGELTTDDGERRAAYARALDHANRAVALVPDSAEAHFLVFGSEGRLAQLDGLATAALKLVSLNKQLDEVLRLDPDHANALAARGGMLMKLPRLLGGDPEQGIRLLERAVSLDEDGVGKRLELAEAYHLVKREDDARRVAGEAQAMAERHGDPRQIDNARRFNAELAEACAGCALASIGR